MSIHYETQNPVIIIDHPADIITRLVQKTSTPIFQHVEITNLQNIKALHAVLVEFTIQDFYESTPKKVVFLLPFLSGLSWMDKEVFTGMYNNAYLDHVTEINKKASIQSWLLITKSGHQEQYIFRVDNTKGLSDKKELNWGLLPQTEGVETLKLQVRNLSIYKRECAKKPKETLVKVIHYFHKIFIETSGE